MMLACPADAAYAAGVTVSTLRDWVARGHIHRYDGCYDLMEILDYLDRRRVGRPRRERVALPI